MILLETLPGWPEAPEMSGLFYTLLMFVGPLLAAGLITVLVLAGGWSRSKD